MDELLPKISNCFDFLCVHKGLLEDKYRLKSYQSAIRKVVKTEDIVIDIGTGTGILSFLAVKAGAKHVYAIEKSNISKLAKQIAIKNRLNHLITFIKGDSRKINIPKIKADVLISELVGHYALDENLLSIIIDARKRFLKKQGKIIPCGIKLYISPVECTEIHRETNFWKKDILGLKYTPALELVLNNIYTEIPHNFRYLATPKMIHSINLYKIVTQKFTSTPQFSIHKQGIFHGFIGWFELILASRIKLITGPTIKDTHWERVFFPISKSFKVKSGDKINLNFSFDTDHDKIFITWRGNIYRRQTKVMKFSQSTRKIYL